MTERERDFVAEATTPEEYRKGAGMTEGATPMPQRNEAAERLRQQALDADRLDPHSGIGDITELLDAALAEERRLVVARTGIRITSAQIRDALHALGHTGTAAEAFVRSAAGAMADILDEVAGESR